MDPDLHDNFKHYITIEEYKWFYLSTKLHLQLLEKLNMLDNMKLEEGNTFVDNDNITRINLFVYTQMEFSHKNVPEIELFLNNSLSNLDLKMEIISPTKVIDIEKMQRKCVGERAVIRPLENKLQFIGPSNELQQTLQRCKSYIFNDTIMNIQENSDLRTNSYLTDTNKSNSTSEDYFDGVPFSDSPFHLQHQSSDNIFFAKLANGNSNTNQIMNCDMCKYIDKPAEHKNVDICRHVFCAFHSYLYFSVSMLCPLCAIYNLNATKSKTRSLFKQPSNGKMKVDFHCSNNSSDMGMDSEGLIYIEYSFTSGKQEDDMPNPNKQFKEKNLEAYLPHSAHGLLILKLLRKCFERREMFLINEQGELQLDGVSHFLSPDINRADCKEISLPRIVKDLILKGIS